MIAKLRFFLLLAGSTLFLFTAGCGKQDRTEDVAQNKSGMVVSLTDKPLAAYQNELLDHAFETPRRFRLNRTSKTGRGRRRRSLRHLLNWISRCGRIVLLKGLTTGVVAQGYCDLAFYCARHGYTGEVQQYLNLAVQISESAEDWRRDQIRVKIANTYTWLGQTQTGRSV